MLFINMVKNIAHDIAGYTGFLIGQFLRAGVTDELTS